MNPFPYVFDDHAQLRIGERQIKVEWVEQALFNPGLEEPHPRHPERKCVYAMIAEMDNRVLKVIYNFVEQPARILTVHFDRGKRGKL